MLFCALSFYPHPYVKLSYFFFYLFIFPILHTADVTKSLRLYVTVIGGNLLLLFC